MGDGAEMARDYEDYCKVRAWEASRKADSLMTITPVKVPPVTEIRELPEGRLSIYGERAITVVGVAYENEDGSNRQEHIKGLEAGALLGLRREPENEYDTFAVAVTNGENCIGYIPSAVASKIAPAMDELTDWRPCAILLETYLNGQGHTGLKIKVALLEESPNANDGV